MRAVFDANVLISGAGWRHDSYLCLVHAARRLVIPFATLTMLAELREAAARMEARGDFPRSPWPILNWWARYVRRVEPALLGKQRSRDRRDDELLGCVLSADAEFIVTRDPDLLVLGKPFGVSIVTPRQFLQALIRRR